MKKSNFITCPHTKVYPDYCHTYKCDTPYCMVTETHCIECGYFIAKCGCHSNEGISGWSTNRWRKHERKKAITRNQKIQNINLL